MQIPKWLNSWVSGFGRGQYDTCLISEIGSGKGWGEGILSYGDMLSAGIGFGTLLPDTELDCILSDFDVLFMLVENENT